MMRQARYILIFALLIPFCFNAADEKKSGTRIFNSDSDIEWGVWGLLREESFGGQNLVFLNYNVPEDQTFYFRHTWDTNARVGYGLEKYGCQVAEFQAGVRQRTIWGNASSTAKTADSEVKIAGVVSGTHSHDLPRLFLWMREGWLKFSVNSAFGLDFDNKHFVTVGAFPFEMGRGIALGAAYAVGPTPLGFFADSVIDQYAFGIRFSGDLLKDTLRYDVYGSLLTARSYSDRATGQKIMGQEFGRINDQMRGFGRDSYLIGARLNWTVFNNDRGVLSFEPYVLYNNDPEQKVEFYADASSKLGTWGLAGEYEGCGFGLGFDMAFNMGHQQIRGWDRNRIEFQNSAGTITVANSDVLLDSATGTKVLYDPKGTNQAIILKGQEAGLQGQAYNGLSILDSDLYSSMRRFRNPYQNQYRGMMIVADGAYYLYKKEFQVAATLAYASGDRDPNFEVKDSTYDGFIGLQEVYRGKRVLNVVLLGNVGKVKRPGITLAEDPNAPKDFATSVGGFTNILFWGAGCTWKPKTECRSFSLNPNVFMYWEPVPGQAYNARLQQKENFPASKFLGTEINAFISSMVFQNLKVWGNGGVLFPGAHYKDISGIPLDKEQLAALNRWNRTGHRDDQKPNIGHDVTYCLNAGIDYTF